MPDPTQFDEPLFDQEMFGGEAGAITIWGDFKVASAEPLMLRRTADSLAGPRTAEPLF